MRLLVALLVWLLRATFVSRGSLALENLALRQQLATYARKQERPRLNRGDRAFWVALRRVWSEWRSPLVFVKPATVIGWHRRGFQRYWRWRSQTWRVTAIHRSGDEGPHPAGPAGGGESRLPDLEYDDHAGNAREPSGGLNLKRGGAIQDRSRAMHQS
jgi:hypothetical protein